MRQIDNQLLRLRRGGTNQLTGKYILGYSPDLEDQVWMAARERLPMTAGDYPLDGEGFSTLGIPLRTVEADARLLGLANEVPGDDKRAELVRFLNHSLILAYGAEVDTAIKGLLAIRQELVTINAEIAAGRVIAPERTRSPFQIRKDLEYEDDSVGDDPADRDDVDR